MKAIALLKGESAHINAPKAELANGKQCVPQHYLAYQHTVNSVEELILNIEYSVSYPVFVCEDKAGIYLQVGVVGIDNYLKTAKNKKIVYGRKWRVEPNLPSSEIIQTVFLAIKKAREHEVRELFRLTASNKVTTPFNCHHDLPLLVSCEVILNCDEPVISWADLQDEIDNIRYDQASFYIQNIEKRPAGYYLLELEILTKSSTQLPELFDQKVIVLAIEKLTINNVLHQLMIQLVNLSDDHVNEHFTYKSDARFSKTKSIKSIAMLSAKTRTLHQAPEQSEFVKHWQQSNIETDLTRVPQLKPSALVNKLKINLASFAPLIGVHSEF
ncbi:MAG: hypothetical protein MJK12_06965 [Colwellia sp.]|nr:hypothetical protein [Colwellia sp.]